MADAKKVVIGVGLALLAILLLKGRGKAETPAPTPTEIRISDLVVDPEEVQVGSPVTISVKAANIGDTAGDFSVLFTARLAGSTGVGEQKTVGAHIEPGDVVPISCTITPDMPGTYNVDANGLLTGAFSAYVAATPADIRVDSVRVAPPSINLGQTAHAEMDCHNYGGTHGSANIQVTLFRSGTGSTGYVLVDLDAGQVRTIPILAGELGVQAGHWIITAGNQSAVLDVIAPTPAPPPPPVANFTLVITGTMVQFTNTSTGQITSYMWDFGDGYTSTEVSPNHIYGNAGTYTVKLTATGPGGSLAPAQKTVTVYRGAQAYAVIVNGVQYRDYRLLNDAFNHGLMTQAQLGWALDQLAGSTFYFNQGWYSSQPAGVSRIG